MKKRLPLTALFTIFLAASLFLAACSDGGDDRGEGGISGGSQTAQSSVSPAGTAVDYNALLEELPENASPSLSSFQSVDMDGNTVSQEIFTDAKLTMVNIWATFCTPCISEMPELAEIAGEYRDKGLQVVGVIADVQDRTGAISASQMELAKLIVEKTGADYRHLLPSADLNRAKLNAVTSVPETVFVDKDGKVVGKSYLGARSKEKWTVIIDELLKEVA